jgi:hypothetical protein
MCLEFRKYLFVYCFVSALGIKRLASDDFANGWESKRLNAGQVLKSQVYGVFDKKI